MNEREGRINNWADRAGSRSARAFALSAARNAANPPATPRAPAQRQVRAATSPRQGTARRRAVGQARAARTQRARAPRDFLGSGADAPV
jgi:hypothetical protein